MNQLKRSIVRAGLGVALLLSGPAAGGRELVLQGDFMPGWGFNAPMIMPFPGHHASGHGLLDGFSVAAGITPIEDTPAGQALRHINERRWVKAIQVIESLDSKDPRMVQAGDGLIRPLASLKGSLLASLPEEGKRIFRKLNAPAAKTKLKRANDLPGIDDRAQAYTELINGYTLCDASAQAALALGDIRFEQGRFDDAATLYRFAGEHAKAPAADHEIIARRLAALCRAGDWQGFESLSQYALFRHASQQVVLGGQATTLGSLIDQLKEMQGAAPTNTTHNNDTTQIALPASIEPMYELPHLDTKRRTLLEALAIKYNIHANLDPVLTPKIIADEQGWLYHLGLGVVTRVNPQTGSAVWQAGDEEEHAKALQDRMGRIRQGYHPSLIATNDRVIAAIPDHRRMNHSRLKCFDADTGAVQWQWPNSKHTNTGTIGEPLVASRSIYAVCISPSQQNQLRLVELSLKTGQELRSVKLGTAQQDPNMGIVAECSPRLAMGESTLFVQTNNGAMIAIDPRTMTIAWAHVQKIAPAALRASEHIGQVVAQSGIVVAKDTRTRYIHAFAEHNANPLWAAETDDDATIVHCDDERVYILGEELVAYDLQTGERVWWTPFHGKNAGKPVFAENSCIIAGSRWMSRIDLATGKLTDYNQDLTARADLTLAGNRLIHVTADKLSAFQLNKP